MLDFGAHVSDLDLVLAKVDSIESDECRNPDLELRAEKVILGRLAGEHGVDRILDQVEVLERWVRVVNVQKRLLHVPHRVVRKRQRLELGEGGERAQARDVVVVQDEHPEVRELFKLRDVAIDNRARAKTGLNHAIIVRI